MKRLVIAATAIAIVIAIAPARGQTLDARRTAMGGVVLPGGGPSGQASNVAYRAVPNGPGHSSGLPLPIGLIPLVSNPPALDPNDPGFNVYELANTLYNPPWNLQLVTPNPPSNDVVVTLGRDHLAVDLGEVGDVFPANGTRFGSVSQLPALGFGVRHFFVGLSALAQYQNDLRLNDALHGALANGDEFRTQTEYALYDDASGQAAAALQLGWAGAVMRSSQSDDAPNALYAGARSKVLRGLAYADAHNQVSFTTSDTLFGSSAVDLNYTGLIHDAGPAGGGWGQGFDLGMVWMTHGIELGVGVNDIATRINWKVRESVARRDSVTGEYSQETVREDEPWTSEIAPTVTVNAARRFGSILVAADVTHHDQDTQSHLGLERWWGPIALRTGAGLDPNHLVQYGGGLGARLGRFGVDVALATNSRNLTRERGLELGAGFSFYH